MYHLLIKILLFSSLILYPFSEDCHEDNDDYPTPSPTCPPPFTVYTNVTNEFDLVPCFGKGFTVEKNSYAGIQVERTNPGYLKFSLASEVVNHPTLFPRLPHIPKGVGGVRKIS
ncbi:unnamed protein product [Meloidogyne enterolobii]|uniref:Uncharacterized protein n=1 Tax=Meloidogyne enterolobii TaxID=390850 RepID=A0ACB0YGI8_MELEN